MLKLDYLWMIIIAASFVFVAQSHGANNVKMAFDFRTSEWKTIEFISGKHDAIKVYTTAEDVTKKVEVRLLQNKEIFIIREKK